MNIASLLADSFERVRQNVHSSVDGLKEDQLTYRVGPDANSIAWLVWHLTRVQDDHIAEVAGIEQVWPKWADRLGLPLEVEDTGYGHSSDEVAKVRAPAELLVAYYDATHQQTLDYIATLTDPDLDRVVDERWDPPVTLGVRLVSVIDDCVQHAGQAMFVRGLL